MAKYIYTPFGVKTQSARSNPDKTQIALTYDILSEGEIEGLSDGLASVFLNDVPVIDSLANEIVKVRRATVSTTASTNTITSTTFGDIRTLSHNNLSGLGLGSRLVLVEKARAKATDASGTAGSTQVTTSSSFFTNIMISSLRNSKLRGFVRIDGAGPNGSTLVTGATFVSATEIKTEIPLATTVSNTDLHVDLVTNISALSGNNATLGLAPGVTLSSTAVMITGASIQETRLKSLFNIDNLQFGMRGGTMTQSPLLLDTDFGQSSIIASPGIEMLQNNLRANIGTTGNLHTAYNNELDEPSQSEGTAADTLLTSAFLGVSNPSEVDEVHLTFNFPACHALKSSSGAKGASFVELQMFFEYSTDGGSSYTSELAFGPSNNDILTRAGGLGGTNVNFFTRENSTQPNNGYVKPKSPQYAAFSEEFVMNTEQFQPYDNWRIRIRRINDLNFKDSSFRHTNPCTLATVESIVKDKLRYPHTSYAAVSFNAKDFNSQLPERAYSLKGLKIQVPTNYLTREETGGAAAYTRNISSGATESTYQNWDGNFRGDTTTYNVTSVNHTKVFCDNPVWVFYDLLINERYGIGQFIDKSQIDIYELFRIAKYCDEEVPDGNGGTEPRFTCNVFLSKAAEATKVLKQFASIFRGVALWNEGNLTVSVDRPKEPVYTFSKANVLGGAFTYEGTGDRVRTNQVKVTWNDPNDNFRQSTEYVEDYESIADTGRIVRAEQLAFACTSRGQAHRLGKWKLLTEQNEKETVSFSTSLNAAGLKPGDVILVQDADKDRASYSGRVSNYNPEAGLTLDETKGSGGASVTIQGSTSDANYNTHRFDVTVFAGEVTLPKTFTQDACLWEHGGTGAGSWLGVRDISGVDNLTLRSGEGDPSVTATSVDGIITNIPIADIPEFDGQVHTVCWELDPDNGTHRLWIDGKKYIDDATTGGGNLENGQWSGGDAGGWLSAASGRSGNYSANSWPVTTGSSGLRHYYNEAVSTSSDGSSTTEIELDRTISLPSYSTDYRPLLHLVYPGSGAYLAEESAIIGGTTFFEGDLLTSITSSTAAANAKDDSNNSINVIWSENVRVEKQPVTTSAGNVSKLTVSSAFTNVPSSEVMWALKLFNTDGTEKVGTAKEFRIVSVKEEDKMQFDIVASAYHRNKFLEIERGYELGPRPTKIAPDPEDIIPAPNNLVINVSPEDSSEVGDTTEGNITGYKATISWDYPTNADGSKFKFCNGFEVEHDFLNETKSILVGSSEQAITVAGIKAGGYTVRVRTKSTINTVSTFLQREVTITSRELLPPSKSRLEQVQRGGELDQSFSLASDGVASFGSSTYQLTSPDGTVFLNTSSTAATHTQAFAGMGASAEAFLLFDASETTDRLKAIQVHTDTTASPNVSYLKEVGASNNGLSSASGTATISKFSNQVDGSSTAFETDFTAGDLVKVTNGSTTTRTTAGATTSSVEVTLSSANSAIEVGMTVTGTGVGTDTVDGETASTGGIPHVVSIDGVNLVLSSKQTIGSGVTLTFTPKEQYVRVRHVQSDTLMFLDEIVQRPYSGTALKKQSFIPDTGTDFILAKITTDGSTAYTLAEQFVTEGGAGDPQVIKGVVYYDAWNGVPGDSSFPSSVSATSYNFDTKSLSTDLTSGWSEDRGTLPYAIADFKFREGDGSVTFGSIEGRGEFSRLPPGGISISVDNSARNFKFRPDSTTTTNDKTVSIPQLFNDQITTNADGTLNNAGGGTAPTIDGISGVSNFQSRVTTGLDSTGKLTSSIISGGTSFTAAELLSLRSNFLSGDGIDFSTGTKTLKAVTPTTNDGTVLQAGGDSTSSHIPLKVLANGTGVIQGFDIFTKSGTKLFDKDTGLTSEALSSIATSTGTSVSSVTKTVSSETASDAIKITNGNSPQVVTVTLTKPATSMTGFSTSNPGLAAAQLPTSIVMTLKESANANLTSSNTIDPGSNPATRTINKATSTTNNGGSDGANTYVVTTQSENDPQFEFHDAEVLASSNTNVLNSEGNFELSTTLSLAADEVVYIFSAISGTAGTLTQGSNNVSATATRTVTVTAASGRTFNVDSSGDGSESSDADITAVSVSGTGLSGGGSTGAVTITSNATSANTASTIVARDSNGAFNSGAITVNTADLTIEGGANASTRALVIKHTGQTGNQTKLENVSNGVYGRLHATERALRIEAGSGGGTGTSEKLSFHTNGSRAMTIDTSQRVGIGTADPNGNVKLHLYKASAGTPHYDLYATQIIEDTEARLQLMANDGGNNAASLLLSDEDKHWGITNHGTSSSHRFAIGYKDTSASNTDIIDAQEDIFNITTAGKVGIGTTSPLDLLHLNSSSGDVRLLMNAPTDSDAELKFSENGTVKYTIGHDAGSDSFIIGTTNVDTNKRFEINNSGVIKFNGAYSFPTSDGTNGQVLQTNGSGQLSFATVSGGGGGLPSGMSYASSILDVTGQIRATGDVTAFYSSDERFKDNIKVIDNAVEKVSQIRGVEFDWNENSEYQEFGHDIGVIAQEVEKVVPEIVIDRDDGFKAVNYQKLTALLIEAVKELKEEIKELKKDR